MKIPYKQEIAGFEVDAQRTFTPLYPNELPVEGGDRLGDKLDQPA